MEFTAQNFHMAIVTHEDGTFILNESVLHSAMAGDVTVVQGRLAQCIVVGVVVVVVMNTED